MMRRYIVLFLLLIVAVSGALIALGFVRGRNRANEFMASLSRHYLLESVRFAPFGASERLSWPCWKLTYGPRDYPFAHKITLPMPLTGKFRIETRSEIISHPPVLLESSPQDVLPESNP